MSDSFSSKCSQCGAVLLENQIGGLCPNCLARRMFGVDAAADSLGQSKDDESHPRGPGASGDSVGEIVPGRLIGRYRLLERIGEGGFGVVFLAEQVEPVKRQVALKVIKLGMDTKQVVARFEAERQALALMDHPHIARVLDGGATESGRPYFVMELVSGIPLIEYCDTHNLATRERLELFVTICQAIQHAHQKGVIHRDIKPSNILVSPAPPQGVDANGTRGIPKVIDFGIAKATQMELSEQTVFTELHQVLGTPTYMSPEQLEVSAADVDTRSDIYSLGVLLYELLTGKTPFDRQELLKAGVDEMHRILREKNPLRPSTRLRTLVTEEQSALARRRRTEASKLVHQLEGDLDWIIMKCLEKDRTRRYETANGLALDIRRHLNCEPVLARPPSKFYEFQKTVRRHKFGFAAVAAIILALGIGITLAGVGFVRANRQKHRADLEAQKVRTVSYGANLRSAIYLRESEGNGGRALQALTNCPVELRDWEWDYLRSRCDHTRRLIAAGLDGVENAVFTPDGSKVVTCRRSGLYQLWDFGGSRELARFQMTPEPDEFWARFLMMHGPVFTPDGEKMVLFDPAKIVVWNLATGEPLQTFTNMHPETVFVGHDEFLCLGWPAGDAGGAMIWDYSLNRKRISLDLPPMHTFGASFIGNARQFMIGQGAGTTFGDDPSIEFWDVASGRRVRRIATGHGYYVTDGDLNLDHQLLVTVCPDGQARVFDLSAPETAGPALVYQAGTHLNAVALSHDGKRLAVGGSRPEILLWELSSTSTNADPSRLPGHASMIQSLQFSPDDRWILSSSLDGTVRAWQPKPVRPNDPFFLWQFVRNIVFSPDGSRIVGVGSNHVAKLWSADTQQPLATLGEADVPIQDAAYSPDGLRLAMLEAETSRVVLWDTASWKQERALQSPPHPVDHIESVGPYLAGYGLGSQVYLWELNSGTLTTQYSLGDSKDPSDALAFSSDGKLLAVSPAHSQGELRLHDVSTGKERQRLQGCEATLNALAFSPDGTRVAAGSTDTTALIWDLPSGRLIHRLRGHTEKVKAVVFSPSTRRLITGSTDDSIRIWKLDTEEELMSLPVPAGGDIELIRFSRDGSTIVAINQYYVDWYFQASPPKAELSEAR